MTTPEPHFVWPIVDSRTHAAVARQLDESISIYDRSGVIERVEKRLAAFHDVDQAVLTNSGTSALHSMYASCDLVPGDEVICPAYTFFATVTPLLTTGAVPVFVDSREDGNIDPAGVEAAITPRTKAIVVTHMWGLPCDMPTLRGIADRHGLRLLEDTSHAFGARVDGRVVGSWGDAAAQSLQGQKPLTGGEGGVVLTSDTEIYYRSVAHGHYNVRCRREIPAEHWLSEFAVTGTGLKLRIHPVAAAIVEQQLDAFDEITEGRERVATRMAEHLDRLPGLSVLRPKPGDATSWYALILEVGDDVAGQATPAGLEKALHAEGAAEVDRPGSTRPLPQLPLFQNPGRVFPSYADVKMPAPEDFPVANAFHESILKLPVWHRREDDAVVDQYLAAFDKVWAHLSAGGAM